MVQQSKAKKILNIMIPVALTVIFALAVVLSGLWFLKHGSNDETQIRPLFVLNESGVPKFIDGSFSDVKINGEKAVFDALNDKKDLFKIEKAEEVFRLSSKSTVGEATFYRLQQTYKGIEVYGQELIISADVDGNIVGLSGDYIPELSLSVTESVSKSNAEETVTRLLGAETQIVNSGKYILADHDGGELVFVIDAVGADTVEQFVISAVSGEIVGRNALADCAIPYSLTGEGLGGKTHTVTIEEFQEILPFKTRHRFVDAERDITVSNAEGLGIVSAMVTSFVFGATPVSGVVENGRFTYLADTAKNQNTVKTAITTLKTFSDIYDYYKNILGRDSYDGDGGKIVVHIELSEQLFSGDPYENAAWNPLNKQMFIGSHDGVSFSAAKDALAHEFTHGVIQHTAKLKSPAKKAERFVANETGALNEAYADIMGILITDSEFKIGEDQVIYEGVKRDLRNPLKFDKPAQKDGEHYFPTAFLNGRTVEQYVSDKGWDDLYDFDKGGAHHNATVPGHAAYLMYEGGAFQSKEEMAKVWYQSLQSLFATADFEDCALNVLKAAKDLGLSEQSQEIIKEAFVYTRMLDETHFRLGGVVCDAKNRPLDRVIVTAVNQANHAVKFETYTNQFGAYGFLELPRGSYTLEFQKDKYNMQTAEHKLDADYALLDVTMEETPKNQQPASTQIVNAAGFHAALSATASYGEDRTKNFKMTIVESGSYSAGFYGLSTGIYESHGDTEFYKKSGTLVGVSMGLEQTYVLHSGEAYTSFNNSGDIENDQEVWEDTWYVAENSNGLENVRNTGMVDLKMLADHFDWFELRDKAYYLKPAHFSEYAEGVPEVLVALEELKIIIKDNKVSVFGFTAMTIMNARMSIEVAYEYATAPIVIPPQALLI